MSRPASPPKSNDRRTFFGVQVLRGVAALMVVIHHSSQFWISKFRGIPANDGWINGASGVDIFFVISGFVMTISAVGAKRQTAGKFLSRRLVRVFPLYWIVTLFAVAKAFAGNRLPGVAHTALSFGRIVSSFLLLPYYQPNGQTAPVLVVGWTLSFEMFFYLIFAVVLLTRIEPIRLLIPIMTGLTLIGLFRQPGWPAPTVLLSPLLLEFLAGVLLAYGFRRLERINAMFWVVAGLAGLAGCCLIPELAIGREVNWGIPAFLLVSSSVMLERRISSHLPRLALMIGNASYSLYLIHYLMLPFLVVFWRASPLARTPIGVFVAFSIVATSLGALGLYRWVEAPLTLALGRWTHVGASRVIVEGERTLAGVTP